MQRIAIVDPNEVSRESLRTLLLGVDFVWLEAERPLRLLLRRGQQSTPDLVIVALDADRLSAGMIQLLTAHTEDADPDDQFDPQAITIAPGDAKQFLTPRSASKTGVNASQSAE
jgi:CheY-like chemotaxis protein